MDPYFPLLQVDVAHGYYADGRCRGLRFVPAGTTAERLRRADALVRADGGSLRIHGPAETVDRLRDETDCLAWRVFATDDDFACGTEDPADRPRELLWVAPALADDALEARPQALASPALDPLLTPHDRRVVPFALLHLPLSRLPVHGPSRDPGAWPVRYRWPLAPRATVWKYCLLGDWTEPSLTVVDLGGEIDFDPPVPEQLDDGTPMLAIRSRSLVPLAQRSPLRLQLRSRPGHGQGQGHGNGNGNADGAGPGSANDKVLIRRLPTAAAQLLARETIAGQPAIVSEIHVHR